MPVWSYLRALLTRSPRRAVSVRDEVRAFLADGHGLLGVCEDESQPLPVPIAHRWAERVEAYLLAHFGPYHVIRFRNRVTLPSEHDAREPGYDIALWQALRGRVKALERIASELGGG